MVKKLFIGLPIAQQVPVFFVQCLLALQKHPPCELDPRMSVGDGVARSRNQLTADFLRSDCTHLLFIDCDLIFSAEHVKRLLDHDRPLVAGMYPKKQEGPVEWVINSMPNTAPDANGLQPVRYIGTGFMLIERGVFEKMIKAYPHLEYTADAAVTRTEHDFWSMGVYTYPDGSKRYLSEDWFFCQRWLDLGGTVLADTRTLLKHIGGAVYPLATQMEALMQPPK